MPLTPGTRLGPYEIVSSAGAGGMGEVYRGRDTRLDRIVAIKVLPAEVAGSSSRRQRLEREARTISQLSHPHICSLHDVGHQDGVDYLVMEFLEGETLEQRLSKGPLPMVRVLEVGVQIAAALDAAHRHGVTHRDLKPGNIMLTATGAKLLDFGLAKLDAPGPAADGLSAAPTRDSPLTVEGVLLGTLQYMAPEQLEGKEADARADIWALGLILHEMTTGRIVFEGQSQAALIAVILERDPPALAAARAEVSPALDHLVDRCLKKDPDERWQSSHDVLMELRWIRDSGPQAASDSRAPGVRRRAERTLWAVLALALAGALALAVLLPGRAPAGGASVARFALPLPAGALGSRVQVSPDGRRLSFPVEANGQMQLWLRPIDSLAARPLPGTEGVSPWYHFWSPDSRSLGFVAEGKLKIIDVDGGPPRTVTDVPGRGPFSMGSWGSTGTILYNVTEAPGQGGLFRVDAAGGSPARLPILDDAGGELEIIFPSFLPDGKHFLFEMRQDERTSACVAHVDTLQVTKLLDVESYVVYTEPGYLLYVRDGALMAHRFDAGALRLQGEPLVLVEQVSAYGGIGMPNFSASERVLVYNSGRGPSRLVWRDRDGVEAGSVGEPDEYGSLRLSPDGKRLMVSLGRGRAGRDLWIFDLERDIATPFTSGAADVYGPVWSPDGRRVAFSKPVDAPPNLFLQSLDQDGAEPLLPAAGTMQWASDWSEDGRFLLYSLRDPAAGWDLWMLPLDGDREPVPFRQTRFNDFDAQLSPDGEHVAFVSDESGEAEIYVMPFEGPGEKRRISVAGGRTPHWRSDGRELYYHGTDDRLMAVPIRVQGGLHPGTPMALFTMDPADDEEVVYDVSADGQRFIINSALPGTRPTPTVLLDWATTLRR